MLEYLKIEVPKGDEIAMALLSQYPFDTFEELPDGFNAFIPKVEFTKEIELLTRNILEDRKLDFSISEMEIQNWNKEWEKNFNPVEISNFVGIRANFHEPLVGFEHELLITPRMAFGTGHHETTHLMVLAMKSLDFVGKSVFDYGCGTGVLAILASKLGASKIDAIDIENESYLNTIDNCIENKVENVTAFEGQLDVISNGSYDIVLANINRKVLIDSVVKLYKRVNDQGILLLSGLLKADYDIIVDLYSKNKFSLISSSSRGNWISLLFAKIS